MPSRDESQDNEALDRQLDESRCVIDHQVEKVSDIDDKAIRTVRLEIVFLGILLSAFKLTDDPTILNLPMKLGGAAIVVSIVLGVFTYSDSRPYIGPGPKYADEFVKKLPPGDYWKLRLLDGFKVWMQKNEQMNKKDARWLFRTQVFFLLGVVLISAGVAISLDGTPNSTNEDATNSTVDQAEKLLSNLNPTRLVVSSMRDHEDVDLDPVQDGMQGYNGPDWLSALMDSIDSAIYR